MSEPRDLTQLQLRADDLNVFVIGPGYGESIVIDLPGPGWLVIDGAGRRGEFPVHELLEAHLQADFVDAMLLTHPHRDHYLGMRELIDHPTLGPRIRRIGCVKALVEDDRDTRAASPIVDTGAARTLLERIVSFWAVDRSRRCIELVSGPLALQSNRVQARILGPTQVEVDAFLHPAGRRSRLRQHANDISVVLELRYGDGRFLFTGDLSQPRWDALLEREPGLNEHELLKLPHHGSRGAHAHALLRPREHGPRTWVLTPFNRGGQVSRPPTQSGMRHLLEHESPLHLTSFPVAWDQTRPAPAEVGVDQLAMAPLRFSGLPVGRLTSRRSVDRELRQRDCYWLFCFDSRGQLIRSDRGVAATRVVRAGPGPKPK